MDYFTSTELKKYAKDCGLKNITVMKKEDLFQYLFPIRIKLGQLTIEDKCKITYLQNKYRQLKKTFDFTYVATLFKYVYLQLDEIENLLQMTKQDWDFLSNIQSKEQHEVSKKKPIIHFSKPLYIDDYNKLNPPNYLPYSLYLRIRIHEF
jgi:hypothetical protein